MDRSPQGVLPRLQRVNRLLADPEVELVPLQGAMEQAALLPPNATVTITASPTRGMDPTLDLAEALAATGHTVVPHLSARSIRDRSHLEQILERIRLLGIRRALVVGGDAAVPGAYPDALSLLRYIAAAGDVFDEIGIAGYPEGHPHIPAPVLREALREKAPFATYVINQLCFDPGAIRRWVESLRRDEITLPVHLGIPGAVDPVRLLAISARIGVGESIRYLRKHSTLLGSFLHRGSHHPDRLLAGLAPTIDDPALGIERLHIFTFNQVEATERWRQAMLRSS